MPTVADICTTDLLTAEPETPVSQGLDMMSSQRKSSLLVTLHGEAIGIVTERDIVAAAAKILSFPDLRLRDIMSSPLLTIAADVKAVDAGLTMRRERVRHLVVLDARMEIFGLLSLTDILNKFPLQSFTDNPPVEAVMAREVTTVAPEMPSRQVIGEMARLKISCVVVTRDHVPLGMFTERDVTRLLAAPPIVWSTPVSHFMTSPHPMIPTTTSTLEAIDIMRRRGIRRLLVSSPDGGMAGLVTQSILGRAFKD